MGVHDSFRGTFTSWAASHKGDKGDGSDHRGELRTSMARVNWQYTIGTSGKVCRDEGQL